MAIKPTVISFSNWGDWTSIADKESKVDLKDIKAWPTLDAAKGIEIYLTYPLNDNPFSKYYVANDPFYPNSPGGAFVFKYPFDRFMIPTPDMVVDKIKEAYHFVYKREAETTKMPEENIPGTINRAATNGEFGIWGHVIKDLVLESIWYIQFDNTLMISPGVGS